MMTPVFAVSYSMTEYELFKLFDKYGTVVELVTPEDRRRGFAFVAYQSSAEAQEAKAELDGTKVGSREISVQLTDDGPEENAICNSSSDINRKRLEKLYPPLPKDEQRYRDDYSSSPEYEIFCCLRYHDVEQWSRSPSFESHGPRKSLSQRVTPTTDKSPASHSQSPSRSPSPSGHHVDSRSPSPRPAEE